MTSRWAAASRGGPLVDRKLPQRPPARVRRARTALFAFGSLLILILVVVVFLFASGRLPGVEGIALIGAIMGIGGASLAAASSLRHRNRRALAVSLLIAITVTGAGSAAIVTIVAGASGLSGNPAFFGFVGALLPGLFGVVILYNLGRELRWFRPDPLEKPIQPTADWWVLAAEGPRIEATGKPLVVVDGLKKHFPIVGGLLRRQLATVYAVDGVDFEIRRGEVLSLVGESGCGKTTLGRSLLQLTPPTAGRVIFDGYELTDVEQSDMIPLRRRMQIIFQDPFGSLNPRMPISDIIGEGLLAQGVTDRATRDRLVEDSLEIVGLRREYTRRYPHEFSGGQRQRIGIARALALRPDFVVCDEPVSALDVSIQSQVLNLLLDLRRDLDLTYLFISHNLSVVEYISDRVGVMYLGKIVELAGAVDLYREPRHPYTVALLSAIPHADPRQRRRRLVLRGDVPSPAAPPPGCRFNTRCWLRDLLGNPERCETEEPELRDLGIGHQSACHFAEDVSAERVSQFTERQSVLAIAVAAGEE